MLKQKIKRVRLILYLVIVCFFPTHPSKLNMEWQCFLIYSFFVPWPIDPVIIGLMMMMKTEYFKEFDIGLVRLNSALRLSDYVQVDKNNKNTPVNKYKKF